MSKLQSSRACRAKCEREVGKGKGLACKWLISTLSLKALGLRLGCKGRIEAKCAYVLGSAVCSSIVTKS